MAARETGWGWANTGEGAVNGECPAKKLGVCPASAHEAFKYHDSERTCSSGQGGVTWGGAGVQGVSGRSLRATSHPDHVLLQFAVRGTSPDWGRGDQSKK